MSEKGERPIRKSSNVTGDYPALPRVIEQMQRTRRSRFVPRINRQKHPEDPQNLGSSPETPNDQKTEE